MIDCKAKMHNSSTGPSSKPKVGSLQPSDSSFKRKRGVFHKDLQHMMYGFGDDPNNTPKLHRCTELLSMHQELKQARKAFDVDEDKIVLTAE